MVASFLLIYSAFLGTIPVGFLPSTYSNPTITPVDPQLTTGFSTYVVSNSTNFTLGLCDYSMGGFDWHSVASAVGFGLGVKIYTLGIFWLTTDWVIFTTKTGQSRGDWLTWAYVYADAVNGTAYYTAVCSSASSAVVFSWNNTAYTYPWNAWGNDSLYIIHGMGASDYAPQSALSLVFGMLTFSLPGIPVLLQVILSAPIYVSILYLIWFFIKEVIPFL